MYLLWLQDPVATVRESHLDLNQFIPVGEGFDGYPFFEETVWRTEEQDGKSLVIFRGVIDDAEAAKHFEENHKFHLDSNLKAIQLEPYYGLTEDKDKLAFEIHFLVHGDQRFDVRKGVLQVRAKKSGEWRVKALTNKAVVEVIKGFFRKRNPYMSLIEGLPFK
jgi:hypothetical protein